MRILVVEDSEKLRRALDLGLRRAGYVVDAVADGREGLWLAESNDYDGLVLDRMLPGLDGLAFLERLRAGGRETPVLMLTVRNEVADRVAGLHAGADDYLAKPFAFEELLARVHALVRRRYGRRQSVLRIGDLEVDTAARRLTHQGRLVDLGPREYRVLELLLRRAGDVVSRSEIEEHIYGESADLLSNAVESAVSILRRKLDDAGAPPLIQTRRGLGYVIAEPPQ